MIDMATAPFGENLSDDEMDALIAQDDAVVEEATNRPTSDLMEIGERLVRLVDRIADQAGDEPDQFTALNLGLLRRCAADIAEMLNQTGDAPPPV